MFESIKNKLIIYFAVFALAPLLILGVYNIVVNSTNMEENIYNELKSKSEEKISAIQRNLMSVENDLQFLSTSFSITNLIEAISYDDPDEIEYWTDATANMYKNFSQNNSNYLQIRFLNTDGKEVVRIDSDGKNPNICSAENLQNKKASSYFVETVKLSKSDVYVSPLNLNKEHGKIQKPYMPVIRYATPVFDEYDEFSGVVIINVNANSFLNKYEVSHSGESILVNKDGYFLAHPENAKEWGFMTPGSEEKLSKYYETDLIDTLLAGSSGILEPDDDTIIRFAPVYYDSKNKSKYWVSIIRDSEDVVFAELNSFITTFVLLLLVVSIVSFFIAIYISKSFSNPINQLSDAAQEIANGSIDISLNIDQKDEIGKLAHSFNKMSKSLEEKTIAADQIAEGNLEIDFKPTSKNDVLGLAIEKITGSLQNMCNELSETIDAQKSGNLDSRCDTKGLSGVYERLINNFNNALDAVVKPIFTLLEVLEKYTMGDLTDTMQELPGQQIAITTGINSIHKNLKALIEEGKMLNRAAHDGHLSEEVIQQNLMVIIALLFLV